MKIDPLELDYNPRPDDPWAPGGRPKRHGGGEPPTIVSLVTRYMAPIRFSPAEPHVIADEAERAIIAAGFPVFHRGGALVEPSTEKVPTYGGGNTQITTLREINKARLIDLMSKASSWEKYNIREKKYLAAAPPASGAEILLERASEWSFPRVSGVITTPTLRRDGSILSEPGYDRATQLYHAADPNLRLPPMAEKPTMEEAVWASI
jgi:putative DNA primase/helicase